MAGFQKRLIPISIAATAALARMAATAALATAAAWATLAAAQEAPPPRLPEAPAAVEPESPAATEPEATPATRAAKLDGLFVQLATPDLPDAARVEADIQRLWGQSGSPAMDLLLRRAQEAIAAQDPNAALDHLNAAIDHDPDFAEAWNTRASVFYQMNEYALAVNDIEHALALEPRHYGAMEGLAMIFNETEHPDLALRVVEIARKVNPNRESLKEAEEGLQREVGASEI